MKIIVKIIAFVLFPIISFGFNEDKHAYNKEKNISKTYSVNDDAQVNITNSYGNINVYLWDENKISIQVNIKVSGNNEKKINERINTIDVDFNASSSKVSAETIFTTKEWKSNNISYEINYVVKIPRNGSIDLDNKYGNISVDKLNGSSAIECKYGSIILGQFNNKNNNINIAYAPNSSINSIDKVNLQSQYSEVDFNKVNNINIEGNYNTFNFQNVGTLNLSSNYTKINSKSIQKIAIEGNYLTLKLGEIGNSIIVNSNYSDIQLSASNKTDAITINGNYSNSKISCTSDYAFDINVNLKYGSFTDNVGLKYSLKSEKNTSKSYIAHHISQGKSKINITTNYGSVQLLTK
ncbi:hypothetical protein [Flavobacterium sp.]|uniref:hypothetical protein n=1 Tax=Flavobacterium sp. TaxID=239 RepID=UPI002635393F|nr:hypothetical protein [Flavobacterium sp.]